MKNPGKISIYIETVSILVACGGVERNDFNSFYFAREWWS